MYRLTNYVMVEVKYFHLLKSPFLTKKGQGIGVRANKYHKNVFIEGSPLSLNSLNSDLEFELRLETLELVMH